MANRDALSSPLMLGSDLAKLRWRFSGNTSLTFGYIGLHGDYGSAGGAYGSSVGPRTIVASGPNVGGSTDYSAPQYPSLVGKTLPGFTFPPSATVQMNQPLFEAELRTALHNDTLLIRPYVGAIYHILNSESSSNEPNPVVGAAWTAPTSGNGCSTQQPCLVPDNVNSAFRQQEFDRLHGTTATLIHPVGEGSLNFSYDYRSDETTVAVGDPTSRFDGTATSISAYLTSIPTTLARNFDWSAAYNVPLTTRLRLFAAYYYTDWKLRYGTIDTIVNFVDNTARRTLGSGDRTYRHNDPHIGFTWRPDADSSFRVTAGSAITVPYAELVSGGSAPEGAGTGTGVLRLKNAALQPESTVAFNLGLDHRFRHDTAASLDIFDNTIHNVFATEISPFDSARSGIAPGSPLSNVFSTTTEPLNAPIERNYGVEFAVSHASSNGLTYRLSATVQRAFLDQLPPSFFLARNSLLNGKQLDGATSIPYAHAYGEIGYRSRSGVAGLLGADYTGSNNWTNGPAFVVWSSMLRYDLRGGYRAQFSIENLFNADTGTQLTDGVTNGGFADVNYGAPVANVPASYGETPTTRFSIPARTFRFQIEAHVGH